MGDIRVHFFNSCRKLSRIKTAQAVRCKVAEAAMAPVYILQTPGSVVFNFKTKVTFHLFVPISRDVFCLQASFNDLFFKLVPDDHVKVISELVGFCPDKRWLHFVDAAKKGCGVCAFQLFRKHVFKCFKLMLPKSSASSDVV